MIEQSTLEFLSDLRRNNYRDWFHEQRERYETARANVIAVGTQLAGEINRFDPSLGYPDLRKCMFRIARDTRFSANKEPYKTNFGMLFTPDGTTRTRLSAYYMHIEPGNSFISCGVYMADPQALKAVRTAIDDEWEEFSAIVENPKFKKEIGALSREDKVLKRVPAGFDKDSPAAEYLKLCHFYVWVPFPDRIVCGERFVPDAARLFALMKPLNDFLNRAIKNG